MKHSVILSSIIACLLVGVLFSTEKVSAFTYVENHATSSVTRVGEHIQTSGSIDFNGAVFEWIQAIETPISTTQSGAYDHWEIDSISIKGNCRTTCAVGIDNIYNLELLDENYNSFATSTISAITTLPISADQYMTWNFDETVWVTSTTTSANIPKFIRYENTCSGSCGVGSFAPHASTNYGVPHIGDFTATSTGGFFKSYRVWKNDSLSEFDVKQWTGSWTTLGTNDEFGYQVGFKIEADNPSAVLSIDSPLMHQTVNAPVTMSGTCSENLNLFLYQGITFDERTEGYTVPVSCIDSQWQVSSGTIIGGYWNLSVYDSTSDAGVAFYVVAQSLLQAPTSTSFQAFEGGEDSFWYFLWGYATSTLDIKPYKYIFQVIDAIQDGITSPSSTDIFQELTVNSTSTTAGQFNFTIPKLDDTQITKVFSTASWTAIRTTFNIVIYISLIMYVWFRIKRFMR